MGRSRQARTTFSENVVHIDRETGEIVRETSTNIVKLPVEPPFVKLYLDDLSRLLDVPDGPKSLMLMLVRKLDFEGMITLSPRSRERIAAALGIAPQTFRNYLSMLVKKEILIRHGHNEFEANPFLFGKGEWREVYERRQNLVLRVKYTDEGRQITTEAEPNQPELFEGGE